MTTTVRLLSTYDGNPPQTIVRLPDALAASFVAMGNASLDLTGGINKPAAAIPHTISSAARLIYNDTGTFLGLGDAQGNLLVTPAGLTIPNAFGKPGAPTAFTLTAAAGAVVAAFTAPADLGGDPSTVRYVLSLSNGTKVEGGSSPISAAAPAGTLVSGTVTAISSLGESAPSASATATPTGPAVASALTLTGPTSGTIGSASGAYTVALSPGGATVAAPVTVTPTAVAGVTFAPASLTLTTAAPSATFTATATTAGTKAIAVTNNGGLTNPTAINLVIAAASTPATALTLTGPTTATTGSASSAYTVALSPTGGTVTGTVTVTPTPVAGVTFTPTSLALTTASPSGTFTALLAADGAKTIAITNNGGLANPASITLTASTAGVTPAKKEFASTREFGIGLTSGSITVGGGYTVYKSRAPSIPVAYDAVQVTLHSVANITDPIKVSVAASASFNNGYTPLKTDGTTNTFTPVTWGTTDPHNRANPGGGASTTTISNASGSQATFDLIEGNVVSDIIPLASLARTDFPSRNRLLFVRMNGITLPAFNGVTEADTAAANPWNAVIPDYYCGFTTGDTTSGGGAAPTQRCVPMMTITFYQNGAAVYTLGVFGDSINQGWLASTATPQTDGLINGWDRQLATLLVGAGKNVECNMSAYQGNRSALFHARADRALDNGQCTHMIVKPWSINEQAQGATSVTAALARMDALIAKAASKGVVFIIDGLWGGQYSTAAIKTQIDTWLDQKTAAGVQVFYARTLADDATVSPPTLKDAYCSVNSSAVIVDHTHPIKSAHAEIAAKAYTDLAALFP